MTEKVNWTLDGTPVASAPGRSVLEAAREAGRPIPSLCHLPGADEPDRPCLLCLVEVEGKGR
ncbi:2Fe-2S iron-sulfur cluster binding domain-containing protein, partial [Dissulfurirhabdus thermomarina]